jgi:hypothetical protein
LGSLVLRIAKAPRGFGCLLTVPSEGSLTPPMAAAEGGTT